MRGYVLLRSNPYMAKSDNDGRLEIKNLPTGQHKFQLWHERTGYLKNIRVGTATADSKGRVTIAIAAGNNDFPEIRIEPTVFEPKK